ncbi:adaptin ear-binding coat-associated protein 1 NECAP-1 [Kipferlia bialata]|uniref:Adaptin ear-binding coat-associated protein 1 NECAP-1 n=1 Tax=Kipferlia bialata TaxID=797122 RepID=A0A9K3GEI4_9EUKA|nr:adaptin ear-binding coat-associated protein 1 NECAP-1 [Kipferlia bialata]|eukprot:g220.t1
MDPADFEQTVAIIPEAHAYKVPPMRDIRGFLCAGWKEEDNIFRGRLSVKTMGDSLSVEMIKPDGALFTKVPVTFEDFAPLLEKAHDSSRYFILIVKDQASGRTAHIGLGFPSREDAFDFKVALQDHGKYLRRKEAPPTLTMPTEDLSLRSGQTIQVNIPGMHRSASGSAKAKAVSSFAPPPGKGFASPPSFSAPAPASGQDEWADFTASPADTTSGTDDWVDF